MASREHDSLIGSNWFKTAWRPAMAWQYFIVCLFDFIIAPVISALFFAKTGIDFQVWQPLTLEGGGLYHVAMGAIVGVTVWSRGKEKLRYMENTDYVDDEDESDEGEDSISPYAKRRRRAK